MFSSLTQTASLVPSLEDVILYQFFVLPMDVTSVHVAPESVEVHMFPVRVAASLVPSLDDVMNSHGFVPPVDVTSVQVACVETSAEKESRATSRNLSTLRRSFHTRGGVRSISKPYRAHDHTWFSRVTRRVALCKNTTSVDDEP